MAISSGYAKLDDVPSGGHSLTSFFDVSFLNDGNKETLLRDISLSVARLDKTSSDKVNAFESKYAARRMKAGDDPLKLAATNAEWDQELPTVMPDCPQSAARAIDQSVRHRQIFPWNRLFHIPTLKAVLQIPRALGTDPNNH